MNRLIASIAVGVLGLGLAAARMPAHAQQHAKPSRPGRHERPVSKSPALPPAVMLAPERLAAQADLAWLGSFAGMSAEEFDAHTNDAIKAFQKRTSGKETGALSNDERVMLEKAAAAHQTAVGWRWIDDSATGARLGIPEKLVPQSSAGRTGSRWASAQGQVQIETFRLHEASLPALFEQEKKTSQRAVLSSALDPDSFVILGEQRLKKFIVRAQASGSEVRGVAILYDQATEGTMAPVAVAISDTFVGFPAPTSGRMRGVDYGSAIVVTSRGELIAANEATAQCQSITVAGFGHAERIAADEANDLALLRLYGARDLIPAALAGEDATAATELTLFGIAAPATDGNILGQSKASAQTSTPAERGDTATPISAMLTSQGIVPLPMPGFSGAAALDARGRFAGIVAFDAPVAAGDAAATLQAGLISAASVRAFLKSQGISPKGGDAAMSRSVVRLICVRR